MLSMTIRLISSSMDGDVSPFCESLDSKDTASATAPAPPERERTMCAAAFAIGVALAGARPSPTSDRAGASPITVTNVAKVVERNVQSFRQFGEGLRTLSFAPAPRAPRKALGNSTHRRSVFTGHQSDHHA